MVGIMKNLDNKDDNAQKACAHCDAGGWFKDTLVSGAVAAASTTAALAVIGKAESGKALAPINAVSHMLWGQSATRVDGADFKHTAVGIALNSVATTAWAGVHQLLLPRHRAPSVSRAVLTGAAVSALAYITDYHVVPKRFTPGFEERSSRKALFGVYLTLAVALAVGSLIRERRNGDE